MSVITDCTGNRCQSCHGKLTSSGKAVLIMASSYNTWHPYLLFINQFLWNVTIRTLQIGRSQGCGKGKNWGRGWEGGGGCVGKVDRPYLISQNLAKILWSWTACGEYDLLELSLLKKTTTTTTIEGGEERRMCWYSRQTERQTAEYHALILQ